MRSSLPKVLHPLAGRPMVRHVVDAVREAGVPRSIVVVGVESGAIRYALGPNITYAVQAEPRGTGHAVEQAREAVDAAEHLVVLNGDVPLITAETIVQLMRAHEEHNADLTFLTALLDAGDEYGLVQRDADGRVSAVIEAADRESDVDGPVEINSGQYCLRAGWAWQRLQRIPKSSTGEYYLTSLVGLAVQEGAVVVAAQAVDPGEVRGINDRAQLAQVEMALRQRINRRHMLAGVTIVDPERTYIDADVVIGQDSVIEPNANLRGATRVGRDCRVGPDSTLRDATIGVRCSIVSSTVEESTLEDGVEVGPYSHLRPGTHVGADTHIGNFAELKKARLGRGVKMGHSSYIGDAEVGAETNIGAGTITCNYDGESKHRTVIGRNVFIGSDTMLVAPVTIGDGARTGAGSVVTRDVPAGALAVGAPARIVRSPDGRTGR